MGFLFSFYFFKYETIVSTNGLSLGYSERDTSSVSSHHIKDSIYWDKNLPFQSYAQAGYQLIFCKKLNLIFARQPQYGKTKDVRFSIIVLLFYQSSIFWLDKNCGISVFLYIKKTKLKEVFFYRESFLILADGVFSM